MATLLLASSIVQALFGAKTSAGKLMIDFVTDVYGKGTWYVG